MIPGVDVSKWQGLMDWLECLDAGAKFAFIRAGSCNALTGQCYEDYLFKENSGYYEDHQGAPDLMPVGFYWYFRPNLNPTQQADYFCNLIKDVDWRLSPVMDIETTGGLGQAAVGDACAEFVTRVHEKLDVWPLIYTRGYFWNDRVAYRSIFDECDLWVARYTSQPKPWGNAGDESKLAPNYWTDWTFWQYSADNNGRGAEFGATSKSIDLDYFNGDEAVFNEYVGCTVVDEPEWVKVTLWKGTVLRDIPAGECMTIVKENEELRVIGKGVDDLGREWYQVASGLWLASWYAERNEV